MKVNIIYIQLLQDHSPTKEELKKMLFEARTKLKERSGKLIC